jgi:hypothetical protein
LWEILEIFIAALLTRLTEEHTETLVDLLIEPEVQEPIRDAV